jgi:hypothetical protein
MTAPVTLAPTTSATTGELQTPSAALVAYPHISQCDRCLHYAEEALHSFSAAAVLQATLVHHESDHRHDSLLAASEYFGIDDNLLPHTQAPTSLFADRG